MLKLFRGKLLWILGTTFVTTVGGVVHRVIVHRHSSKLPSGPVLVISNHVSTTEPLALAKFIVDWGGRYPHFMAKEEVLQWPVVGTVARWLRVIPVARGKATASASLLAAQKKLEEGALVCMYPEGRLTTHADLSVDDFKTGAARLALAVPEAVVVPIAQWEAKPGKWRSRLSWITRPKVRFLMGEPLDLAPWKGCDDAAAVAEITTLFRESIIKLLAQVKD